MRIADKMQYNQTQQNITQNRTQMADLQNQAATQKRINKPSDDPLSSARVLSARTEERGNTQFIKNINNAKSFLEFTEQSLGELNEILVRAKELAISQANDASGNAETRQVTAAEIEQIYNQSVQIGNRKLGERYVFGGFKTQTPPFNTRGEYSGDNGEMKIQTHKESFISMNIPGNQVFQGIGVNKDGITRAKSETPRTVNELAEVRNKEVKEKEDDDKKQKDFVPVRGPASLKPTNEIKNADPVTPDMGTNVFQTLKELEISLRTNDKVGVQNCLDSIDAAISQVVLARSESGARVMAINSTLDSLQKSIVDNKILASQLEDADVFQVVSEINKTDSALKATLETSGKVLQQSLMDFVK